MQLDAALVEHVKEQEIQMSREPQITSREQLPEHERHVFDMINETRGTVMGPFPPLLNSPEAAYRATHLGTYLRFESTLSAHDPELAVLTTSRELDCDFEWVRPQSDGARRRRATGSY